MTPEVEISSSKSLVNRYLILREGYENLKLDWKSEAEDVLNLKEALSASPGSKEYYLGEGGTTLRFFVIYLSTYSGEWVLKCKSSLLDRPQLELIQTVEKLGASLERIDSETLILKSQGWQVSEITLATKTTTQVLTALVLASLARSKNFKIGFDAASISSDYFKLTLDFVRSLGFEIEFSSDGVFIPENQNTNLGFKSFIESDWSSAAFLFVLAALKGSVKVRGLSKNSFQPDSVVIDELKSIGAKSESDFYIEKGSLPYSGFKVDLKKSPDLFPVLCALACFCEGESVLFGAPQLRNKETDRIFEMTKLIRKCGYEVTELQDGIRVVGAGLEILDREKIHFDVSKDHRLYMASEILRAMGYNIIAEGARSIRKSFPEYEELKEGKLKCFF